MKVKGKYFNIGVVVSVLVLGAVSCKPSEQTYRQAYERAVSANDRNVTDFDQTIYNRYRSQVREATVDVDGREVKTRLVRVKVTEDGGGIREWLKPYSVVVGEFKQLFNAKSLRSRFVDAGYAGSFIVENGEPYYYIVAASSDDLSAMVDLCEKLQKDSPLPLKEGFPYILQRQ